MDNLKVIILLFICASLFGCSVDCEEYLDFVRETELKGEVFKFSVYGRYVTLGLKYKGQEKEKRVSMVELYTNEDKIHIGDTLIKEKGKLRWFIHSKKGIDTIYTECGEVRAPYTE